MTSAAAAIMGRYREKFVKEARTIARLDHPGIVRIHDVFEENGTAYYVMDFIEGDNLNDIVKREGPLSEDRALGYIRQIADALSYVHSRNIMHLDVKPANIIVRKTDDKAILIDFGASKQYDSEGTQTSTTPIGLSAGYAPIELLNVGGAKTFSPETDVYSLGATLYYLVSGKNPPGASERMEMVMEGEILDYPKCVSKAVIDAIECALQSRKKRPHTISLFVNSLPATKQIEPESEHPKLCAKCGEEVKPNAKFCPNCGTAVGNDDTKVKTLQNTTGFENGHEWVDLGLSVKWATCNIGATSPADDGYFFSWGETEPRIPPLNFGNKYIIEKRHSYRIYKYNDIDKKGILDYIDDAARTHWGGNWRIPTKEECEELAINVHMTWTHIGSRDAYKLTSRINGNSIFLPAPMEDTWPWGIWTSSIDRDLLDAVCCRFERRYKNEHIVPISLMGRGFALWVRPVTE